MFFREYQVGVNAIETTGMITDVRVTDGADGPVYHPVVQFKTRTEEIIGFEGMPTSPPAVKGTSVPVLYDSQKPMEARINTFVQRWLFPTIFTPIGVGLLVFAYIERRRGVA